MSSREANADLLAEIAALRERLASLTRENTELQERQTATAEILRVIASSPTNLQPVMDVVAETAARVCGATDALVYRVEGSELRLMGSFGDIPAVRSWPLDRGHLSSRAVIDREPVHVHDIEAAEVEFPISAKTARPRGTRTCLATPLLRGGVPIGVIAIRRLEVRPFSDSQIELLKSFADQAVIAIENVRLFKELEARNRDLTESLEQQTATSDILRVISSSPTDVQPVLDVVAETATRLCESRDAVILRRDGDRLRLVAHHGPLPFGPIGEFSFPLVRGTVAGRTVLERRTVHVADWQSETDEFPRGSEFARQMGFRTASSRIWRTRLGARLRTSTKS